ncbi:MAG: fibronectin type III-like domain-contianing protein [Pseudomonadota bacterium]
MPLYYNCLNTGRPGPKDQVVWAHYSDVENSPLYPFGHGLSYSEFLYSNLNVEVRVKHVEVTVRVENTSSIDGEEVVQLYIRDRVASISRPVRELKAFRKLNIPAGEGADLRFELSAKDLGFYDAQGQFRIEPGQFEIHVGGSSQTQLSALIELPAAEIKNLVS